MSKIENREAEQKLVGFKRIGGCVHGFYSTKEQELALAEETKQVFGVDITKPLYK